MDKDQFLLLATRVLSGNAEAGEEQELRSLIQAHPELREIYEQYTRYWQADREASSSAVEAALARTWEKIHTETTVQEQPAIRSFRRIYQIAAAAAVAGILLLAGWLYRSGKNDRPEMLVSHNPRGVRSTISLPDGTRVWLGGDSRLEYPAAFTGNKRELKLEGEAFFEVFHNREKPFVVHLRSGDVRVLGTSFNIRSYLGDSEMFTSVSTGKVAFVPAARQYRDSVFLTPGRKLRYLPASDESTVSETDAFADRAWTEGTLVFTAEPLADITLRLERFYGRKIVFRDEKYRKYRYTGTFRNSTPEQIIHYLSRTKAFPYTISDTAILIGN